MSSSQLDDMNEQAGNELIAKALGITADELEELNYGTVESNESSDGLVYNYYIDIQKASSDEEVLNKVMENTDYDDNNEFITAYLEFENLPDDDERDDDDDEQDGRHLNDLTPMRPKSDF